MGGREVLPTLVLTLNSGVGAQKMAPQNLPLWLQHIGVGQNSFLDNILKSIGKNAKIDKWDSIKLKPSAKQRK
jgi:hypothetical protein